MPSCLEREVLIQCILPILIYGSQMWMRTVKAIQRLQTIQRSMELHIRHYKERPQKEPADQRANESGKQHNENLKS